METLRAFQQESTPPAEAGPPNRVTRFVLGLLALFPLGQMPARAEGLLEPDLILYGVIRNAADGNVRLTEGSLVWKIVPAGGGIPITVTARLTNLNDQFSYVLSIPCESYIGSQISSNTLKLLAAPIAYDRAEVTVMAERTNLATFVTAAQRTFTLGAADRGRVERVDLTVSLPLVDYDGDGLPDRWELANGLDPFDPSDAFLDYDGDGLSNRAEYRAGTDPNDAQSSFEILDIQRHPAGGLNIRWSSVANRKYSVLRSGSLLGSYSLIKSNLIATPALNTYHDAAPPGAGPFFYRLKIEE